MEEVIVTESPKPSKSGIVLLKLVTWFTTMVHSLLLKVMMERRLLLAFAVMSLHERLMAVSMKSSIILWTSIQG